jgi:hypothetical protein
LLFKNTCNANVSVINQYNHLLLFNLISYIIQGNWQQYKGSVAIEVSSNTIKARDTESSKVVLMVDENAVREIELLPSLKLIKITTEFELAIRLQ